MYELEKMIPYPRVAQVLVVLFMGIVAANGLSCQELGFRETLLCSSCKQLEQYVPDKGNYKVVCWQILQS